MKMNAEITPKNEYLYVKVEGEFELNSAVGINKATMEAFEKYEANKILVDCRRMTGTPSLTERFEYVLKVGHRYLGMLMNKKVKSSRFAYVGKFPQIHPNRFGEIVARNRGFMAKATDKLQEAFEWLDVEPDMEE